MEKENEQPPPISLLLLWKEIGRIKKDYPEGVIPQKVLDSITSRLEKKEREINKRVEKLSDKDKLLYSTESLRKHVSQNIKHKKSSIEIHKKYVKSKGNLSSRRKSALNELGNQIKNMTKWHGRTYEETEGNSVFREDYEAYLNAILKATRLGFIDHPIVKRCIESFRVLGHRDILTKARTSRERVLEKGVMKPINAELIMRIEELFKKGHSLRNIHHILTTQKHYTKSWQAFHKFLQFFYDKKVATILE